MIRIRSKARDAKAAMPKPHPKPKAIWANSIHPIPHPVAFPFIMLSIRTVSIYEHGSLLPLSISSSGAEWFFSPSFLDLRIENTEAASVELTTAPSRKLSTTPHPKAKWQNNPVSPAVTITPRAKKFLTIPVNAMAYGRSVADLKRRGIEVFRPKGKNFLAYKPKGAEKSQVSEVLYILARRAVLKHEPALLPAKTELEATASAAARHFIFEGKEQ